ncbi:MAG: hypothetical protein GF317_07965 [Candidatus Lokiarchaeota archaeon]|nr:hypothetical protein [Candidatus Lokiarchaeota archaeon]MBD3199648.1 hypothetical protein [Candidatus Lokiarchaeota archaeon]
MVLQNKKLPEENNRLDVLFLSDLPDNVTKYFTQKLKEFSSINLIFPNDRSDDKIEEIARKAQIIVGWRPTIKLLKKAKNLKLFIIPGTGVNHLITMFRKINQTRKVLLANGHGNSYFVAQHAVSLLLSFMSKIIPHHLWMKEGIWRTGDEDAASIPLRFKKVGLLGYGAINRKVHKFLMGFDIEFSIFRKDWSHQTTSLPTSVNKYSYPNIEDFLKEVDILIIAVPVTDITKKMIAIKELEFLGSKGILVNVARGEIVDEEALYFALKDKTILGAAIDVWYEKKPKADKNGKKYPFHFPFQKLENVVLSPHRGYSPFKDLLRWDEVIENIIRLSQNRTDFINLVDLKEGY